MKSKSVIIRILRKKRRELNIYFETNSNDLCNTCVEHSIHHNLRYNEKTCDCFCKLCEKFRIHIKNANESRNSMRTDAENSDNTRVIFSADMQKALLFPIISVKDNFFSEKLTLFNQTFAGLGPNTDSFCYISFDAEIAKGSNEFVNFYLQLFKNENFSAKKSITLYVDNCSHQNKNWLLYSNLLMIINDPTIGFEEITFVYLDRRHTFLSADRVHANVENIVRKFFTEFFDIIKNSRKKLEVKTLTHKDIYIFQNMQKTRYH